jgi:putative pyruvate formate lyase activating enzyme
MGRQQLRIRVSPAGFLEVVDPGFDCLDLIRAVDPGFQIRRQALPTSSEPKFLAARRRRVGYCPDELHQVSLDALTTLHSQVVGGALTPDHGASLLDLKIEIAGRYLRSCVLCGHHCGVDRTFGETGICGLGAEATVAEHFVHIAEESPLNPTLLVSLAGCGLRCRYCQQWKLLAPSKISGAPLDARLWRSLDVDGARSLSFAGGNPDESLFAVLRFLREAPEDWSLPVVWNNHAYCTPEVLHLLEGVVDIYLPDLKYGNNECGLRWSGVPAYSDVAHQTIARMLRQDVPVIVRMLVLPGHFACCHVPALERLAEVATNDLRLSVRGQYCPDWKIGNTDGAMSGRPQPEEVEAVRVEALRLGLRVLDDPSGLGPAAGQEVAFSI